MWGYQVSNQFYLWWIYFIKFIIAVQTFSIPIEVSPQSLGLIKPTNIPRSNVELLVIHCIYLKMLSRLEGNHVTETRKNCFFATIVQSQHENTYNWWLEKIGVEKAAALTHDLITWRLKIFMISIRQDIINLIHLHSVFSENWEE